MHHVGMVRGTEQRQEPGRGRQRWKDPQEGNWNLGCWGSQGSEEQDTRKVALFQTENLRQDFVALAQSLGEGFGKGQRWQGGFGQPEIKGFRGHLGRSETPMLRLERGLQQSW